MTNYMDSPRNVFPPFGQRCRTAGPLPCEEARQLVQVVKERLGGWYYCTGKKSHDQKHRISQDTCLSNGLSAFPELLVAPPGWTGIENKWFDNEIFWKVPHRQAGKLFIGHKLLVNNQVMINFLITKFDLIHKCANLAQQLDRSDF